MGPMSSPKLADRDSAEWLRLLGADGAEREAACARLHEQLIRVAHAELRRRRAQLAIEGPELDDLAHQAAADALVAITAKLGEFRGESRFTTWAFKFVMFEVSHKLGRHFWRTPRAPLDAQGWERLPGRFGFEGTARMEWHELMAALRRAIEHELTERQRRVFVALVLDEVPLDAVVAELDTNRNAVYNTMFEARRKLRAALVADGHLDPHPTRRT
jgi:RNA polymerase sigma-70 factor (ECF subfamily)